MLKKRRKKMQGYARRYFVLTNSGVLSYSFDPKSPTRDSILLRNASLSSSERRRDIHIDSGTSTFHARALTQDDFNLWIGSCRKFVNVGEIVQEESEPIGGVGAGPRAGSRAGHARSYSRATNVGFMNDQKKALGLLSEMDKTLHDLEEAITMIREDDSKKKYHTGSKSKKDKDVKEKEKEKEGLFGLFSSKKTATPPAGTDPLPPPPAISDETLGTPTRVSFAYSTTSAPSTVHSYLTSTIHTLRTQHSALTTFLEARNITPVPPRSMSPHMGTGVDLSRSRSMSGMSTRRHSTTSEVTSQMWFDASDGADEFFLDADESEGHGVVEAVRERQSDVEEEEESEEVVGGESSEEECERELAPTAPVVVAPSTEIVRRTRLPAPNTGEEGSLFAVLKKNVGKDLSTVSFPVSFNEPVSVLQRLAEDAEYTNLLDEAVAASDPVDRIALVAAFAVSGYACTLHRASRKPFNPMLGETFEDTRLGFIAEKVSHHPPIMACHAHGEGWEFWCTSGAKNKFWGKSLEIIPMGAAHVRIGDQVYSWQKPSSFMRNLIAGNRYLEHVGPMSITSSAGYRCDLDFKEGGFWSSTLNHVGGSIISPDAKVVSKIEGTWHEGLSQHLDSKGSHLKYYGFTAFTITLNELTPDLVGVVPPTDSRLRPDQRAMEEGRIDDADQLKIQLEEGQRARRRAREEAGEEWKPQWFEQDANGEWKYKGGYWETRKTGKWSSVELW
ncbi:unnamed protein product [Rhizoctonia solani]|uniref:PH domain-containing protein n=1 Tax=Rhizoctonia solani TaxID=456999 RepID=A0A8H3GXY7_9AGAM|nr:unnamed protein product [Rhizoctonia solani]